MTNQEDRKQKQKKIILECLEKNSTVQGACHKVGISRMTYYRWTKEDILFGEEAEERLRMSRETMCDVAETALLKAAKNGEPWAPRFILSNLSPFYKKPTESFEEKNKKTKVEVTIKRAPKRED